MKKSRLLAYVLAAALAAQLAGCATICPPPPEPPPSAAPMTVFPVNARELQSPIGDVNPAYTQAAKGANDFAFTLSAALLAENGGDNFVCSPYSVWLPLAALLNAADAAHRPALTGALAAAGLTAEEINAAASRMLYSLTDSQRTGRSPLQIANAVFADNEVTLKKEFAQVFADYYRGAAMNVDFSSQSAVDEINKWASEHTDGLIDDIVEKFGPNTVAAIANAVYFSDRWRWEFNAAQTREDVFRAPGGDVTADFMRLEGGGQQYYEDERVQAAPLYFKSGGALWVLLPKDGGAEGLLASMDQAYFDEIQQNTADAAGTLLLPKFSVDSGVMNLKDALVSLGVPLFDEDAAPLTGGLIEGGAPVWVSAAVQKAVIDVYEEGTTAAAVTVISMDAGSALPPPAVPFEMICDKPFVFLLCGNTYDGGSQILFTGVVGRP
ncbi:MAG: hypothetical protein LBT12_06970 [Oscillospiraceae bacterium]|nr:hypothetical protein [Oscillospiraceae bacterium]